MVEIPQPVMQNYISCYKHLRFLWLHVTAEELRHVLIDEDTNIRARGWTQATSYQQHLLPC